MTITFQGHVDSLRFDGRGGTLVEIIGESATMTHPLIVRAPQNVANQYTVGIGVQITIYPMSVVGCRPEDRAMLQSSAGQELVSKTQGNLSDES